MTHDDLNDINAIRELAGMGMISKAEMLKQMKVPSSVIAQASEDMARHEREHVEHTQRLLQQRIADEEYRVAYNKERMEALATLFPRGHAPIRDIDKMVDIARDDQLNPLYEQVLKDFEDAKLVMSRAANKLAQAVKLTDSEKLDEMRKREDSALYGNSGMKGAMGQPGISGLGSSNSVLSKGQNWSTTVNHGVTMAAGPVGPTGAVGMTGPKGDKGDVGMKGDKGDVGMKGDKGDKGDPGRDGAPGPWFGRWLWDRILGR